MPSRYAHYTEAFDEIRRMTREGPERELEGLLLWCLDETEAEDRRAGGGVAPFYYGALSLIYRSRHDAGAERGVLERFAGQAHAPGCMAGPLLDRLGAVAGRIPASAPPFDVGAWERRYSRPSQ